MKVGTNGGGTGGRTRTRNWDAGHVVYYGKNGECERPSAHSPSVVCRDKKFQGAHRCLAVEGKIEFHIRDPLGISHRERKIKENRAYVLIHQSEHVRRGNRDPYGA